MRARPSAPRIPLAAHIFLVAALGAAALAAQAPRPISVTTFNIRYATDRDGENRWALRRRMAIAVLRAQNPDIIGVQEALRSQLTDISNGLAGYAVVGVGRDDGKAAGEYSAILFRTARFRVAQSGTFWFSDTPEAIASRTWGNRIPRICTWARLIDADGTAFWVYNVHLDHESQPSRERSVRLLLERIRARPSDDEPVVVTGDFNVGEDNAALGPLLAGSSPRFVDTFRRLHPTDRNIGTYTGFEIGRTNGAKIDFVLVEPGTEVLKADIIRTSRNGRYPSDHFPVTATIRWKS